jgi:hypothetical protein
MTKHVASPKPQAPTLLHLDDSRRIPATKKGIRDRLRVQTACGKGRGATSTTDREAVTCPACRATMPAHAPLSPAPAPASVPKRFAGQPAKPCKDGGMTIYGATVTYCVPCGKQRGAAR